MFRFGAHATRMTNAHPRPRRGILGSKTPDSRQQHELTTAFRQLRRRGGVLRGGELRGDRRTPYVGLSCGPRGIRVGRRPPLQSAFLNRRLIGGGCAIHVRCLERRRGYRCRASSRLPYHGPIIVGVGVLRRTPTCPRRLNPGLPGHHRIEGLILCQAAGIRNVLVLLFRGR
eukprot:914915-Rhodomonas_salina.1